MQIWLNPDGPPMWFLGEPKKIIVSLNYVEPGPVEVDFESLEETAQKQLLVGLRDGLVLSDKSFQDLYQVWLKSRPTVQEVTEDPQEQIRLAVARQAAERVAQRQKLNQDKERKFEERCSYLSQQSVAALKTTVNNETDERVLHALLKIEEQGKQRTMVVRCIHDKLRRIEAQRAKDIEKETQRQIKANPQMKKTSPMSVVESDQETITLTPEDLIEAVTASGGE